MAPPDEHPTTVEDVLAHVRDTGVRFIRLWFTDILGQLKSFSINSQDLEGAFEAVFAREERAFAYTRSCGLTGCGFSTHRPRK